MPEPRTLLTDLILGESPRWHDDRLWFSDWGAQEVLAVDLEGTRSSSRRAIGVSCVGSLTGRC